MPESYRWIIGGVPVKPLTSEEEDEAVKNLQKELDKLQPGFCVSYRRN